MKRFGIGFAVVLSLSLILAFLTVSPGAAAADKTTPPAATAADKPAPSAATAADKTILIGFTASKTGKLNVEATRQINGLNLWVEQVNKAGGIKLPDGTKIKVETKYYDDESNKDRVQELYTRLISSDKADFLISPYSSGLADAAAVIARAPSGRTSSRARPPPSPSRVGPRRASWRSRRQGPRPRRSGRSRCPARSWPPVRRSGTPSWERRGWRSGSTGSSSRSPLAQP